LAVPLAIETFPASLAVYSEEKQTLYALPSKKQWHRSQLQLENAISSQGHPCIHSFRKGFAIHEGDRPFA
jgi:hypothetical protein